MMGAGTTMTAPVGTTMTTAPVGMTVARRATMTALAATMVGPMARMTQVAPATPAALTTQVVVPATRAGLMIPNRKVNFQVPSTMATTRRPTTIASKSLRFARHGCVSAGGSPSLPSGLRGSAGQLQLVRVAVLRLAVAQDRAQARLRRPLRPSISNRRMRYRARSWRCGHRMSPHWKPANSSS
jgi:hypothetical protein